MVKSQPIDWRYAFNAPTLEEIRVNREGMLSMVEGVSMPLISETDNMENETKTPVSIFYTDKVKPIMKEVYPILKSSLRIVRVATVAGAIFAITPVFISTVGSILGFSFAATPVVAASAGMTFGEAVAVFAPVATTAIEVGGWENLINKVIEIAGYLADGVIIFSGVSWMFGNRTKAIEILLGSGIGYVIIQHHDDIKSFFELI